MSVAQYAPGQITPEYVSGQLLPGSRLQAFAESGAGDVVDIASMYGNPASVGFLRSTDILVSHRKDWDTKIFHENAAIPLWTAGPLSIGVGANAHHSSTGQLTFQEYGVDVGVSFRFFPVLAMGVLLSGFQGSVDGASLPGGMASVGIIYSPSPSISYGIKYVGMGTANWYHSSDDGTRSLVQSVTPDRSVEIGSSLRFPSTRESPTVIMSISGQKYFRGSDPRVANRIEIEEYRIKGGLEFWAFPFLGARIGYFSGPFQRGPRYSLAVAFARFQLGYTAAPAGSGYRFDVLSLHVRL